VCVCVCGVQPEFTAAAANQLPSAPSLYLPLHFGPDTLFVSSSKSLPTDSGSGTCVAGESRATRGDGGMNSNGEREMEHCCISCG